MGELKLDRIDATTWEIPRTGAMRVPGRIIANEELLEPIRRDKAADQVANVACLPGVVQYSMAMPDAHWGYGFPIGGVAATDPEQGGVVSPGGVGYDINCGCRVMLLDLEYAKFKDRVHDMTAALYRDIPCGVGSEGAIATLNAKDLASVLTRGAKWAVDHGYGTNADLESTEDFGCIETADAAAVSDRAKARGADQLGTLGSGNHFGELGVVEQIFDDETAEAFGLREGFMTFMVHCGSRGLGYQICDDFLVTMLQAARKYKIDLPDRQLCCAPVNSPEARQYMAAMAAGANYAWANRQIIMELARRSLMHILKIGPDDLGGRLLYDVCHNIAKMEEHVVDGEKRRLCVHRKGATRAFPGSRPEVVPRYKATGQPVLIPGDMGTGSFVLAGTARAMKISFGSSCHGAGRVMSRSKSRRQVTGQQLRQQLEQKHIVVRAGSMRGLAEEAPDAYKDLDRVVNVVHDTGMARKVARTHPMGVIKG